MHFNVQQISVVILTLFLFWAVSCSKENPDIRPVALYELHSTEKIIVSADTGYEILKEPLLQLIDAPRKAPFHSYGCDLLYFYNPKSCFFERDFNGVRFDIEGFSNLGVHGKSISRDYKYVDIPPRISKIFVELFPVISDLENLFVEPEIKDSASAIKEYIVAQKKYREQGIIFNRSKDNFTFITAKELEDLLLRIERSFQFSVIDHSKFSDSYFSMSQGEEVYMRSSIQKNSYELIKLGNERLRLFDQKHYVRTSYYDYDQKKHIFKFYVLHANCGSAK